MHCVLGRKEGKGDNIVNQYIYIKVGVQLNCAVVKYFDNSSIFK